MTAPRYDLALNPPYQINYRAKRAGKHVSATKRRITFQFGFSSARAIRDGREGRDARGEEHEVVLVWSHISGKREIFLDGRPVHMSKAARANTKFEHSWGIPGGHIVKIIAHGTPATQSTSYSRQFDLEIDGMSFFRFAKIYELGGAAGRDAAPAKNGYSYRGRAYREEEEEAPAPVAEVKVAAPAVDLFDSQPTPMSQLTTYESLPSLGSTTAASSASYSYEQQDEFAPVAVQKTFDSISSEILCAYGNANPAPAPSAIENASTSRALVPVSEEQMDAVAKSMKNLVNLDDITTGPVQPLAAPTSAAQPQKKLQSWDLVGRQPTLAEMRSTAPPSPASMPTTEVMKQPPMAYPQPPYAQQQPQAMVAYGQPQPQAPHPGYGYNYGYAAPSAGYSPGY